MKELVRLGAAAAVGALIMTAVAALAAPTQQTCSGGAELTRINQRFDDLEQAIANLQTQSTLANTNNQHQLADVSNQISTLNASVAALAERVTRY
jgi:ubiquinone biosynthesis protein UbiJ